MIKYLVQKQFFMLVAIVVSFLGVFKIEAIAQQLPSYSNRFYYFYEVGNQIPLSDFALGSAEKIKDKDGNGLGFSWVIREGNKLKLELDLVWRLHLNHKQGRIMRFCLAAKTWFTIST